MGRVKQNWRINSRSLAYRIEPILYPFIKKKIVRDIYFGHPISKKATVVISRGSKKHSSKVVEALTQNGYKVTIESVPFDSRSHVSYAKRVRYHASSRARYPIHGCMYLGVTAPPEPEDVPPFPTPKPIKNN